MGLFGHQYTSDYYSTIFAVLSHFYFSLTLWKFYKNVQVCPFLKSAPLICNLLELLCPLSPLSSPSQAFIKRKCYLWSQCPSLPHSLINHCNLISFSVSPSCQIQWILFIGFALTWAFKNQRAETLSFGSSFPIWRLRIMQTDPAIEPGAPSFSSWSLGCAWVLLPPWICSQPKAFVNTVDFQIPILGRLGLGEELLLLYVGVGETGIVVRKPNSIPSFKDWA